MPDKVEAAEAERIGDGDYISGKLVRRIGRNAARPGAGAVAALIEGDDAIALLRQPLQKKLAWRDFLAIRDALGGG